MLGDIKSSLQYKIAKRKYFSPPILDRLQTSIRIANDEKLSLVRFGDGELSLIIEKSDLGFQNYNAALSRRLEEIFVADPDDRILVCLPDFFQTTIRLKKGPRKYWTHWIAQNKAKLTPLFRKDLVYGDATVTRLYLPWRDVSKEEIIVNNLRHSWENKSVLLVEGTKTRWGVGNNLLSNAKEVKRVLCPPENAFAIYSTIHEVCVSYGKRADIVLLALGPTATVLAYDLAKQGIRALDLGHLDLQYEYLLRKVSDRTNITGKYNNELQNAYVEDCTDKQYLDSIIVKLCND